ncbi:MAG TPA: polysaccharide export protein [Candidatus Dorea intestinavium]|nr:polysaccharide export protein [Candidatus Dorea intestinavium]
MNENQVQSFNQDDDEIEIDLVEIARLLLRKWWLIIAGLLIGAIAAMGIAKIFVTPMYESSSMIYVLSKTTSVTSAIDLQLSKQLTVDFETLAKSRPVIETVIDDLNLDYTYKEMLEMVTVENPSSTSILRMTVQDPDPERAKEIADAMADATADRVSEVMLTDKPSNVESAVVAKHPVSPNIKKYGLIGGLGVAILIIAILVLLHLLDDTIKNEDDVKKYLNAVTLAALPKEKRKIN